MKEKNGKNISVPHLRMSFCEEKTPDFNEREKKFVLFVTGSGVNRQGQIDMQIDKNFLICTNLVNRFKKAPTVQEKFYTGFKIVRIANKINKSYRGR